MMVTILVASLYGVAAQRLSNTLPMLTASAGWQAMPLSRSQLYYD